MAGDEAGLPGPRLRRGVPDRRRRRPRLHDPRRRVGRSRVGARCPRAPDHPDRPRRPGDRGSRRSCPSSPRAGSCSSAARPATSCSACIRRTRRIRCRGCAPPGSRSRSAPTILPTSAPRSRASTRCAPSGSGFSESDLREITRHRDRRGVLRRGSAGRVARPALAKRPERLYERRPERPYERRPERPYERRPERPYERRPERPYERRPERPYERRPERLYERRRRRAELPNPRPPQRPRGHEHPGDAHVPEVGGARGISGSMHARDARPGLLDPASFGPYSPGYG